MTIANDHLYRTHISAIWIPEVAEDLQLHLCITAHTAPCGHRVSETTEDPLQDMFYWSTILKDAETFVRSCIHCISTLGGGKVPRLFCPAANDTTPGDLLQFDHIEIAAAAYGEKHVFMLCEDHKKYCWLFSFPDTLAENAARAVMHRSVAFGVPRSLMTYDPTHFRNETLQCVLKGLLVLHHFTLQ